MALGANEYDSVLRLDVKDFYPSVDHSLLFEQIKKRIRKGELLVLIANSLKQPTVAKIKKDEIKRFCRSKERRSRFSCYH